VSQNVMVVGRGKPYHVSQAEANQLVRDGRAVWKKAKRRIKFTAGKQSLPKVRGLSCYVGALVTIALRDGDRRTRDIARSFVNGQLQRRERVVAA